MPPSKVYRTLAELAELFDFQAYLRAYGMCPRPVTSSWPYLVLQRCRDSTRPLTRYQAYFTPLPVRMAA